MSYLLHYEELDKPCQHTGRLYEEDPCRDCHLRLVRQAELQKVATEPPPPACLQIPLPNLEILDSLPF
jgi:hypothetical protein